MPEIFKGKAPERIKDYIKMQDFVVPFDAEFEKFEVKIDERNWEQYYFGAWHGTRRQTTAEQSYNSMKDMQDNESSNAACELNLPKIYTEKSTNPQCSQARIVYSQTETGE